MMQAYGFSIQTIIVAANSSVVTGFRGDFIRNMDTSGGVIYLGVDGQPVSLFPEAASYRLPAGMEFKEFKLENRSNTDITVQVAVALGEVGYSALQTSATLDVNIVGGNAAPLEPEERQGLTKFGANNFYQTGNIIYGVVFSGAANANGAILRTAHLQSNGSWCVLASAPNVAGHFMGGTSIPTFNLSRPLLIEAGQPLYAYTGGVGAYLRVTWDFL